MPWSNAGLPRSRQYLDATAARDRAVGAFFALETALSSISEQTVALEEFGQDTSAIDQWKKVQANCYAANDEYLRIAEQFSIDESADRPDNNRFVSAARAFARCETMLGNAVKEIQQYQSRYASELHKAQSLAIAVPDLVQNSIDEVAAIRTILSGSHNAFSQYPSVRKSVEIMEKVVAELHQRLSTGSLTSAQKGAKKLALASADVRSALEAAPGKTTKANTTLAAVRTRIDGVTTQSLAIAPTLSELLRNFNIRSSEDLSTHEKRASALLAQAEKLWFNARTSLYERDPEKTLTYLADARSLVNEAENLCEEVTDRLSSLIAVRSHPESAAKKVRFSIRDAQLLAVNRGLVKEWGSVLDAQVERVERASSELAGRNPDYWSYLQNLNAVSDFVDGIIQRIRDTARQ
ncbi:MAG: hypothetical protein ACRCSF_01615 [Mycobacteriaceae bacterium]